MMTLFFWFYAGFCILLILASYSDIQKMFIPNWISLILNALFVIYAILTNFSLLEWTLHLAAAALALIFAFLLRTMRIADTEDFKLFITCAFWTGLPLGLLFFFLTAFFGMMIAIIRTVQLYTNLKMDPTTKNIRDVLQTDVPYGIAIAIGAIITLPLTELKFWR